MGAGYRERGMNSAFSILTMALIMQGHLPQAFKKQLPHKSCSRQRGSRHSKQIKPLAELHIIIMIISLGERLSRSLHASLRPLPL